MSLQIALIDDHPLVREGLREILAEDPELSIVGEAEDVPGAFELLGRVTPDVLILDVGLPGASGISAITEIQRRCPAARILMLSMFKDEERVTQALALGASGYVLKTQAAVELVRAVRTVAGGRLYLAPEISRDVLEETRKRRKGNGTTLTGIDTLSKRQREIFDMIVQNWSNQKMAMHLKISVKTIETHRVAINRKLEVHSTAELIRYAAVRGLVSN